MKSGRIVTPVFVIAHIIALHLCVVWFRTHDPVEPIEQRATVESATVSDSNSIGINPDANQLAELYIAPSDRPGPLDLRNIQPKAGRYLADLGQGWTAELSTNAYLQGAAKRILDRGKVPFGAVVVLDIKTGDVLAMADRYDEKHPVAPKLDRKGPPHLALRAIAPAASIFKIITAAGLIDGGLNPNKEYCYRIAKRRLYLDDLKKKLGRDAHCQTMGLGLAKSNNGMFGRLTHQYLDHSRMEALTQRFGFNTVMPFPLLTEASTANVPRGQLERARMGAGFWHSKLSPLHAAAIVRAVATDGTLRAPRLVKRLHGPDGRTVDAPESRIVSKAMEPSTAKKVRKMLAKTIPYGTGRRAFKKWPKSLRHIKVAGKTGTLAKRSPYTSYTWFVGYAPADNPQVAIAVMVGNSELWWQRAIDIGRDVLAAHFKSKASRTVAKR